MFSRFQVSAHKTTHNTVTTTDQRPESKYYAWTGYSYVQDPVPDLRAYNTHAITIHMMAGGAYAFITICGDEARRAQVTICRPAASRAKLPARRYSTSTTGSTII